MFNSTSKKEFYKQKSEIMFNSTSKIIKKYEIPHVENEKM